MSASDKGADLALLQSTVPSQAGSAELVSRGLKELLVRDSAEEWYDKGYQLFWGHFWDEAVECFRHALTIAPHHTPSQYMLGVAYLKGWGVIEDKPHGLDLIRKAADLGDTVALFSLGDFYENGRGEVIPEPTKAAAWYFLAAEHGHPEAAFRLAYLYEIGKGVQQDHAHAATYYRLAAERGITEANEALLRLDFKYSFNQSGHRVES